MLSIRSFKYFSLSVLLSLLSLFSQANADGISFTGVSGFGIDTNAGQGGKIIKVTNTHSQGKGSLRWAVNQPGKRIVVFEVGGVINLQTKGIRITQPFLTIAGETAPFPGITLIRGGIRVASHDVRIRHLMIRPGDNNEAKRSGWESDGIAVSGKNAYNVHVDHCSLTWAVDENLSASGPRNKGHDFTSKNITFSNSIIAEALDDATHNKGKHSKGLLVHDYVQNVAVIGNLFAHNDRRNPYFKGHTSGVVVNNLMYNLGNTAVQLGYIDNEYQQYNIRPKNPRVAVVGNKLIYGQSSYSDLPLVAYQGDVFLKDNQVINLNNNPMPQQQGVINALASPPVWPQGFKAIPIDNLSATILTNVGARPWQRDLIDQRIVRSVKQNNGHIINSQAEVGGYPNYPTTYRKLVIPDKNITQWLARFAHK